MSWIDLLLGRSDKSSIQKEKSTPIKEIESFTKVHQYLYDVLKISDLDKRNFVTENLKNLAKEQKIENEKDFLNEMHKNEQFHKDVINIVTVNETYFLREQENLDYLVDFVEKSSGNIKILSMPCSTGEEVYSILILLHHRNPELLRRVQIVGIDINDYALQLARKGRYKKRVLHYMSDDLIAKYFTLDDGYYIIDKMFLAHLQLLNENIFQLSNANLGLFDVVLSRNLFIYFDDGSRKLATEQLVTMMKQDAILIMGHADRVDNHQKLDKVKSSIYKKVL